MISYSERESRYEWSVEVQQALAFAVQCVGLRHASALHPGPEEGEGKGLGVLQRLAKQPGLLQACKSVVTACMAAIEREVWQEVQLLGRTASQLSGDSEGLLRPASSSASSAGASSLPSVQLEAILTLLVARPVRWSALMTLLSNLMGSCSSVLVEPQSQSCLQQLQSAIKTLADSWCQALAEVSQLLSGRLPQSAQQEGQWMQHVMQYSDAGRLHKVWSLSHGSWTLPIKRLPEPRDEGPHNGRRRSIGSFPLLPRGGSGTRPNSAAGGPNAGASLSHGGGLRSRSAMSHARSGALALTGPMPGTPAPLLIEAYACHAATMAVASVAIAAATSGANGGGSGGVAYGVSCPASLSLPVSSLQAVLLSTSAERAHRLAASPTLLMLPAADVLQVQAASLSDAPRPASSAGGGVAVGDTAHPGNSRLGSAAAPTAGPSEGSATDGSAVVSEEQATTTAKRGILGKPPLPTSATADPSALTPLPKRLTQLAPASGLPRVGSGSARRARPGPPPSGSGSLLVLQLGFFLSNARRQLSSMGILTDMNLVKALGAGGSSSVAGVASEGLDHWPERGAEPQRHWQLQLALSRPLVSPVLRQATEQLGFVGTSGAADMHGNKGQPGSTVNGSGRQAVPVGGAVSRQLPQLAALEAAAASSGHELLRSVVACIASVLEVTCAPSDSQAAAKGALPVTPGQPRLLAWPVASMLLLLDAGCPHPNLGSTSLRSMSPWGQVLPPAVVGTLMELVHATLLTAQGVCCQVAQLPLLYPKDARTDDMCLAHSRGLALFERLHRLMEACMALLRQQWQLGVLERAAGTVPGAAAVSVEPSNPATTGGAVTSGSDGDATAAAAQSSTRRGSMERVGSNGSSESRDERPVRPASSDGAPGGSKPHLSDPANAAGFGSGSFSGAMSKLKSVFRGSKVRPTSGSGAVGASGRISPGSHIGSDVEEEKAAAGVDVRAPSGIGRSRQRKLAMQMSWAQLLVLERLRQALVQLRGAVADAGRALLDAFTQGARDSYRLVAHTDWAAPPGAAGNVSANGTGGGGSGVKVAPAPSATPRASIGAERVLQGLLMPLRTTLLSPGLHPQSRAFLVSGAVSVVLQVLDEQLQEASKRSRLSASAFKLALAGGQLSLDLGLLLSELAQYQQRPCSPPLAVKAGEGEDKLAEVEDWGMGPTLETLRQQVAAFEARWTTP